MLHQTDAMRNNSRQEQFAVGQLDVLPDDPLVLMAWIRGFERISAGANLEHEVGIVFELEVMRAGRDLDEWRAVEANAVLGSSRSA